MKSSAKPLDRTHKHWVYAGIFLLLLSYPLIRLIASGVTLTGQYEESLGYRYFYTLRQLYDPDPYVFLPQGQLMDLANRCIQKGLTGLGYRPDQLFPRIDIFGYLTLGLVYLLSTTAFFLISRLARNWVEIVCLGLLALVPYCDRGIWGFNVLLQPDYPNWIVMVSLYSSWAIARASRSEAKSWGAGDVLLLATLISIALTTKITLLVYPAALTLVLLSTRATSIRSALMAVVSWVAGIAICFGVLLVYLNFHLQRVRDFINDERRFGSSVRPDQSYFQWLRISLHDADFLLKLVILMPLGAACFFIMPSMRRRWALPVSLLAGAVGYHFALYFRYQPVTCFEAAVFLIFALSVALLVGSGVGRISNPLLPASLLIAAWICFSLPGYRYTVGEYYNYIVSLNRAQSDAAAQLAPFDDRIAFLIPDNSYRPLTVDSDIWKGGSNIFEHNRFPASPFVRQMYPNRSYFSELPNWYYTFPANLSPFQAVVFTIRVGVDPSPDEQLKAMQNRFQFSKGDLSLYRDIDFGSQRLLIWVHSKANAKNSSTQLVAAISFTAKRVLPRTVNLDWQPVSGGLRYEVEMQTGSGIQAAFVAIGQIRAKVGHYVVGDVSPDSSYSFRLRPITQGPHSPASEPVFVPAIIH